MPIYKNELYSPNLFVYCISIQNFNINATKNKEKVAKYPLVLR